MKLFLDDIRHPYDDSWILVKNYDEFVNFIENSGIPEIISFDHDLGEKKTGLDCAKFLLDYCIEHKIKKEINFKVHSRNLIGATDIEFYMEDLNKIIRQELN